MRRVLLRRRRGRRGKRGFGERGAAVVEFALIVPVFSAFVFSMIDFGSLYANQIAVRQGVREGARSGAVAQFGTSNSCVNAFTSGMTPSTDMQNLMCVVKNRIGLGSSNVYVKILFDSSDGSYGVNNGLIVCAQTPATSVTGFTSSLLGTGLMKSKVEMDIEKVSGLTETAGEEAPPAGASWSWCTTSSSTP